MPGDYLDQRFAHDQATVEDVQAQADSALRTLEDTYLGPKGWPYALTDGQPLKHEDQLSHSTSAMIMHAVAVAYGVISSSVLVPAVRTGTGTDRDATEIAELLREGLGALVASLNDVAGDGPLTISGTWGSDDPLTLTWLYELLTAEALRESARDPLCAKIKSIAQSHLTKIAADPESVMEPSAGTDDYPVHHPFLLLRWVQLANAVGVADQADLPLTKLPGAFLNVLRAELSNTGIKDGGFDPACLVFALEGLLIVSPATVTDATLERVVNVLGHAPSTETHWRPVRPLTATGRGLILL